MPFLAYGAWRADAASGFWPMQPSVEVLVRVTPEMSVASAGAVARAVRARLESEMSIIRQAEVHLELPSAQYATDGVADALIAAG